MNLNIEQYQSIYQELGISIPEILKIYALNQIEQRVQKYQMEITFFEKKYRSNLESFQNKVKTNSNEENFEWEDDLMDWEFAQKNYEHWSVQKAKISQ